MSINSTYTFHLCSVSGVARSMSTAFLITKTLLLLPLSSLVLYLGLQRWRRQRSFDTTSHSDIFTYTMAAVEMLAALGSIVYIYGSFTGLLPMIHAGDFVLYLVIIAQMLFHVLTCVERYLAVVHPVTYMGLRQSGGARIRNISIVSVWLLSFGFAGVAFSFDSLFYAIIVASFLTFSIIVVSFCSLRVLCVLIRPGPGEVGGTRERVDQSKQRAFYTMVAITSVLWLWFVPFLVSVTLVKSHELIFSVKCVIVASSNCFNLPSSLVLPLLFLHRAGKPACCC